jgi:hypothetical protein
VSIPRKSAIGRHRLGPRGFRRWVMVPELGV